VLNIVATYFGGPTNTKKNQKIKKLEAKRKCKKSKKY
jgi:hypothetical protein